MHSVPVYRVGVPVYRVRTDSVLFAGNLIDSFDGRGSISLIQLYWRFMKQELPRT